MFVDVYACGLKVLQRLWQSLYMMLKWLSWSAHGSHVITAYIHNIYASLLIHKAMNPLNRPSRKAGPFERRAFEYRSSARSWHVWSWQRYADTIDLYKAFWLLLRFKISKKFNVDISVGLRFCFGSVLRDRGKAHLSH